MARDTDQSLIEYSARCDQCGAKCYAKNAQVWAHQHARNTRHTVKLELGYMVSHSNKSGAGAQQGKLI